MRDLVDDGEQRDTLRPYQEAIERLGEGLTTEAERTLREIVLPLPAGFEATRSAGRWGRLPVRPSGGYEVTMHVNGQSTVTIDGNGAASSSSARPFDHSRWRTTSDRRRRCRRS